MRSLRFVGVMKLAEGHEAVRWRHYNSNLHSLSLSFHGPFPGPWLHMPVHGLFFFGCVGSSFLCEGFLQLWRAGATLHRGARAFHRCGLSCCGAQVPDAQAQQLWLTGPVAPRHVGSSQTRARTRVPCIGRQILNHCTTREAPWSFIKYYFPIWGFSLFILPGTRARDK